jgi:hypothetical protein
MLEKVEKNKREQEEAMNEKIRVIQEHQREVKQMVLRDKA